MEPFNKEGLPCLKSLEDWQVIIDVCPRPAVVISQKEEILLANEAFGSLLGTDKNSFRGLALSDLFEENFPQTRPLPVKEVFCQGQRQRVSLLWRGSHWWIDLMPLKDREGKVRGLLVSFTNLEQLFELLCFKEGLPEFLWGKDCQSFSTAALKDKFEALSLFAKGIVHDLRNLITILDGNLALALRSKNEAQRERYIHKARQGIAKIKEFAENILAHTRIAPSSEQTNLAQVVEELAELVLADAEIDCVLEIPTNLWQVRIDQVRLVQLLQNILLNAKEAVAGKGVIIIKAENFVARGASSLKDGPYVRLTITDNGPGIEPERLRRIFDPYFSTKRGGHGLGLAIVYHIIQAYQGHLEVFSTPGKGTSFVLYLPAVPTPSDEEEEKKTEDASASLCLVVKPKLKVLVVDDEQEILTLYQDLLNFLGCNVAVAAHPEEALKLFKEAFYRGEPFELAIIDMILPEKDGFELLEEFRKIDPHLKAVIASGLKDERITEKLRLQEIHGFLKKPFGLTELEEVIKGASLKRPNY